MYDDSFTPPYGYSLIVHILRNLNWYRNLCKGKYTPLRAFQTALNIAMTFCMIGLTISGVMLSRYVSEWFPSSTGMVEATLRQRFRIEKGGRKGLRPVHD